MRVGIVNYGMGNIASIRNALESLGVESSVMDSPGQLPSADRIILPGVGAFAAAMRNLEDAQWVEPLRLAVLTDKRPLLGICLGMQLLLTSGDEGGSCNGLDLVEGQVKHIDLQDISLRLPHIGWNEVNITADTPLFRNIPDQSDFYFVHSYTAHPTSEGDIIARTRYGGDFVVAIRRGNVFGVQFHPEKSSIAGRKLLENFLGYRPC